MRKYLLPILLIGFWGCGDDKESNLNNDYIGDWLVTYQGRYENSDCTGQLTEDVKIKPQSRIDSVYVQYVPTIQLTSEGRFILKEFCPECIETEAGITFFEGNYFDQDGDSIIGGYDEYANISPGNDYNINGDLEVIKCDIVHSKNYPCHAGSWTSVDNIITLTYDFSGQSFNYYVDQDGDYLTLQIEHIYTVSTYLLGDVAEYQCRKVIRAKK